jgi:hypothetical protein
MPYQKCIYCLPNYDTVDMQIKYVSNIKWRRNVFVKNKEYLFTKILHLLLKVIWKRKPTETLVELALLLFFRLKM